MIKHVHLLMLISIILLPAADVHDPPDWRLKVDPWVLDAAKEGPAEFIVFLSEQADLSGMDNRWTKIEKGKYVFEKLTETAERTQLPIVSTLQNLQTRAKTIPEYRSFWVANAIWVRGDASTIRVLAERHDVGHIYSNPHVFFESPEIETRQLAPDAAAAIEWNIQKVRAPDVWEAGFTGQGVVIGGQDTGYDWDHPALQGKYRGWNGTTANHNYSWHDAIHENDPHTTPGNPCGFNSPVPCDDDTHGTHTMGIMVGDDGLGHQIGMAPGARWIGCRNMEQGWGTPASYMECYQWFIAPTDLFDQNPRPDLAPDVINNSWRCTEDEGCTDPLILQTVVENVRAAGILTAHSAGNSGPSCNSVNSPAAIYDASFTVGNTDSNDNINTLSSRGPVNVDGSERMKPDVSAPGTNIISSIPSSPGQNFYASKTGTSMASPHVAGLAALLISANPDLAGQVDQLEEIITRSAVGRTSSQICGGVPGSQIPNNTYGWGRIDAANAVDYLFKELVLYKWASDVSYDPGEIITYTLSVKSSYRYQPVYGIIVTDTIPVDTSFITGTMPHQLDGNTIVWEIEQLNSGEVGFFNLTVRASPTAVDPIINQSYSASALGFETVFGPPVTLKQAFYYYLPCVLNLMMIQIR